MEEKEEFTQARGWQPIPKGPAFPVAKLAAALAKAQGDIEGAKKGKVNPAFRSKYADLASCWDACREPLSSNGLSVVQFLIEAPAGQIGLETTLLHESGESLSNRFFMPVKDAGNPQAVGSAVTYARRYALCAVVGIAPAEDDGNAASGRPEPNQRPAQAEPTPSSYQARFDKAQTPQERKAVAAEVRGSTLPAEMKNALLTRFNEAFKAAQGGK